MKTGVFILTFTLLVIKSFNAFAAPFDNFNPSLTSVSELSFRVAGIYWLPDYLKDNMDTNHRTDTDSGGGDRQDLTCSTYGACAGIPANMVCSQNFIVKNTSCYKSCSCKRGYNRVNGADVCQGCANPCNDVTDKGPCAYGCQTAYSTCSSKCQTCYADNCRNRNAVSTPYGCKTYFADCSSKCQTAYPDNCHNRTAVTTPYGCQTFFADCKTKCQTAFPDNCRNYSSKTLKSSCINGCAQGKTLSDCSSRCSVGCKAKCETGFHLSSDQLSCVEDSCPSGYEAGKTCGAGYNLEKSGQSGTQYCGKCEVKACTAGSTSCNTATQNATANGYYSGTSPCYTCTAKTCEQMGQKTCNGSCIAATQCCGSCGTGQRCSNGTCVEIPCESCFQKEACNSYQTVDLVQSSNPNCHTCKITATGSNAMICSAIGGTCRTKCKTGETTRGKCALTQKCCIPEDPCQCSSYAQPVCADGQTKSYNSCTSSLWKCEGTACESGYSTSITSCAGGYSLTAQTTNAKCKKCVSSCNSGYALNRTCPTGYRTQTQSTNPNCKKCVCIDSNTCVCNSQGGTCLKSCPMGYAKIGMCGTSSNICCVQM